MSFLEETVMARVDPSTGASLPRVSVSMITYNHERYIAQAIDSVLAQKVDFDYEVVIGEDCSTDRTRSIVESYARQHPDKIRLVLSETNIGGNRNGLRTYSACRGEYTAFLEGDDYWTSPHKLQRQVDFLEQNPKFAICGHWVMNVDEVGNPAPRQSWTGEKCPEVFGLEQALGGTPLHPGSWVFRSRSLQSIPQNRLDMVARIPAGDDPLLLLLLTHGQGYCFRETMGAYRLHSGGRWSALSELFKSQSMLQYKYSLPQLLSGTSIGAASQLVARQIRGGEDRVARAIAWSLDPAAVLESFRAMRSNGLVPGRRIPAILVRVPLHVTARLVRYPRALAGRALRGLGLRRV
ncbi:MAG TPA: glycosyltransferase [bacterium]|nr:glycosyltransferase [bacterium]